MTYLKRAIPILCICLFLSGCYLFTEGKKKLAFYCPGLAISLDSVQIHESTAFNFSSRKTYILGYDLNDENFIKNYFLNGSRGYSKRKDNTFFKKEVDDTFIDDMDDAVSKTIKTGNNYAVIIFNQTKHTLIIVEYLK